MAKTQAIAALERLARKLQEFEAPASRSHTGTGSRREGDEFQRLATEWWDALSDCLERQGARQTLIRLGANRYVRQSMSDARSVCLPTTQSGNDAQALARPAEWFQLGFGVREIVQSYPGEQAAIERYAPGQGQYAGASYPCMYDNMTTSFDGTIVLEEEGVLREKILLEYKTAKSSRGIQVDGNAHERLSFQIMQYLEVATRYTKCSFVVLANGAFIRYRNKYHVSFHAQADRLRNFAWFDMKYLCEQRDYMAMALSLADWLLSGKARP